MAKDMGKCGCLSMYVLYNKAESKLDFLINLKFLNVTEIEIDHRREISMLLVTEVEEESGKQMHSGEMKLLWPLPPDTLGSVGCHFYFFRAMFTCVCSYYSLPVTDKFVERHFA